ncbi:MAG: hypothetical protein ACK43K_04190, partial [Chitinophagales bacterium]
MNSIHEYLKDVFKVDGKFFSELSPKEKELFLKYQIPIIDLDIDNEDPEIIEIFQRLNRTFYSLSGIEKLSTEYASSEFMLLAKFLTKEFKLINDDDDDEKLSLQIDPNIPKTFIDWANTKKIKYFDKLIIDEGIFTPYELTRQVHLTFTLNLMSTYLSDFYNRSDFIDRHLNEFADNFPRKDEIVELIELSAQKFLRLKIRKKSYWYNKANAFSIMCLFLLNWKTIAEIDEKEIKIKLEDFEQDIPSQY